MLKKFFRLSFIFSVQWVSAIELDFPDQIGEGEKYYVELERKSQSYGDCWRTAMSNLHTGCKQLTEDVQSRLALSFTNCFLKHAGRNSCDCTYDDLIADCLKNCSDSVFNTYTQFFTHTQSVCHYLQHREWQIETAKTALLLTQNSQRINKKLDESAKSQSKILELQKTALTEQKKSISNGKILNAELMRSRESAKDLYNEFKTTTYEQKMLLFEVFDRMKNLQSFVLGEFTGMYTVAYYLVIATLVYILTSVPRTADARIWLIVIISLNAVLEKFLTSYFLQKSSVDVNPIITSELLYERIWLCRKAACLICTITLIITYYRYKDYNVINNELLKEIQQQNAELQNFIKGLTFYENFQNGSPVSKTLLSQPLQFKTIKAKTTVDRKLVEKINPQERASNNKIQDVENKENSSPVFMDLSANLKTSNVTPNKRSTIAKKTLSLRNQVSTTRPSLKKENILSDLESPNSSNGRPYNLRSSSRLNSPTSPS